jgi:hypothetical protein
MKGPVEALSLDDGRIFRRLSRFSVERYSAAFYLKIEAAFAHFLQTLLFSVL